MTVVRDPQVTAAASAPVAEQHGERAVPGAQRHGSSVALAVGADQRTVGAPLAVGPIIAAAHTEAHLKGLLATDDSVLVEALGVIVSILPAGNANIKITTPQDLELAAAMLSTPNL